MDWRDQGLLLTTRRHGESSAIIEVFTAERGRHAGLVRGGAGSRMAPILQPGAQLDLEWRARLSDHLGTYRVEMIQARAALLMRNRASLAGFNAVAALLTTFLPEREPNAALYTLTLGLIDDMTHGDDWPAHYAAWELGLLASLGFPLDLTTCAATGSRKELTWVSPKSGRAVSAKGGEGWEDRLLPLPPFLKGGAETPGDIANALALTGHFLTHWLLPSSDRQSLPDARSRLLATLGS